MNRPRGRGGPCGFSYVEVLLATVLIAIALAPALNALEGGLRASAVHTEYVVARYHLVAKLEEVLAEPFGDLDAAASAAGSPSTPTSYSDPSGADSRRLVYLSRYDRDNADADDDPFTGVDEDLLWVRVEIEGSSHSAETLTGR